ncbi:ScbR family autoregulator-binding transcription factor [Saccharopolyspora gloriosae]|uniref:ScbR family autoregulator-binding transcription factor n=1 Tax=Saccharopolyspora gloriosae TaxID=455344 RepID=UPI001FB8117D|nr:ScbR family autoregulator-binding transcription factor [Saccharopolyspora gloriosae]
MPQQRRAQVTRRVIVVAAAEEFDRVGFDATPLSAILRRSGVTKGAFYFHFPSKDAVAAALVRFQAQVWSKIWQRWTSRGLDPLTTAVELVDEVARVLERDVVVRSGAQLAMRDQDTIARWERLLAGLLRSSAEHGLLRPDVDPAAATRVLCATLVGVRVLSASRTISSAQRTDEIWRLILGGIATADWLRDNPSVPAAALRPS